MKGSGGQAAEHSPDRRLDLPALFVQLDADEPRQRQQAVETVRSIVDDRPDAVVPTVPKLRSILSHPTTDGSPAATDSTAVPSAADSGTVPPETGIHEDVAYCLAELASVSPDDVVPLVDELTAFVTDSGSDPATPEVLRCLSIIARERPGALVDHLDSIAGALEHPEPTTRAATATILAHVSAAIPETDLPGEDRLVELLADDDPNVRSSACAALGEARVEGARPRLETLATDDPEPDVRERASQALARLR